MYVRMKMANCIGTIPVRSDAYLCSRIFVLVQYRKNSLDSALIIIFGGWAITLNDILIIIFAPGRYVHLFTRISQGCLGGPRAGLRTSRCFLGTSRH